MRPAIEVILKIFFGGLGGPIPFADEKTVEEKYELLPEDYFHKLPSAISNSIGEVYLLSPHEISDVCNVVYSLFVEGPAGCIKDNKMYLNNTYFKSEIQSIDAYTLLAHEGAHLLLLQLEEGEVGKEPEETIKGKWPNCSYGNGIGFKGENYSRDLKTEWEDGSDGPRYGFISAYSANNFHEDVAELVEAIATEDYNTLAELIDSNSSFYRRKMGKSLEKTHPNEIMTTEIAKEWAAIYRQKIDLLHEYGFMTKTDYRKIIED